MVTQELTLEITQPLNYEQRRAFHQLPLAERRKLLAEQAERAVAHYEDQPATQEREEWQGGDLFEC